MSGNVQYGCVYLFCCVCKNICIVVSRFIIVDDIRRTKKDRERDGEREKRKNTERKCVHKREGEGIKNRFH